jgi:serine phosphatase RsbU (regulator of sigma subunit)
MKPLTSERLITATLIFLLSTPHIHAQEGEPFMSHIRMDRIPGNRITAISDDLENTMVFTGNTGVITFDSEQWSVIPVPNIPMAVSAETNRPMIYVGGRGFFGYLLKSDQGRYEYYALNEEGEDPGDIDRIYQTKTDIIYYGEDLIAIADRNELYSLTLYRADSLHVFSGLFIHRERSYVNLLGRGIYELSDGRFIKVEIDHDFEYAEILFGINYDDSLALFGLDDSRVFRFNGSGFSQLVLEDQEYLNESYLDRAVWLGDSLVAFSSILGGCMIVDISDGSTKNILNYNTGLPDDEIYAIGVDQNRGLWMSHQYGLTRVDVGLPIRSYENYPGLTGNLTAVAILDSTIYLGTHDAVFFLEEKKEFLEEEIRVRVREPVITQPEPEPEVTGEVEEPETEARAEEVITARERRQQKRQARKEARLQKSGEIPAAGDVEEEVQPEEKGEAETEAAGKDQPKGIRSLIARISGKTEEKPVEQETSPRSRTRYIKQKIYSLQSISHEYTRIGEVDSRVKDMLTLGDRIMVSTNAGLYEILDGELNLVRRNWYVEGIFPASVPGRMHVVTDETAYTLELGDKGWETIANYGYIDEEIYSVCEQGDSTVWLGCDNLAYRIRFLNDSMSTMHSFVFHEEYYDPVNARNVNDTVYFFLAGEVYYHMADSIYGTGMLEDRGLSKAISSGSDITWLKSGERWTSLQNQDNYHGRIDLFLNLFEDVTDLFLDPDGNVWVLHANELLHKIEGGKVPGYRPGFEIYLKGVYSETRDYSLGELQFGYHDRSIVFDFSAPFYLKEASTAYQYFVEGVSEGWSEWANVTHLSFPVLPMGKFTLHVRSRNVLNQVTAIQSYPIVIRPPFWLSWWFISLASLALIAIVVLLIRWRVRKLKRDNQILEEKVRERTAEIRKQKDEIAEQKKEIMDSIHYAQRIQKAALPTEHVIQESMPEHFIFYLPRDIVSGDFYWIGSKEGKTIFAAADCTGHGVPGAFMSMLGVSFLNEIVNKSRSLNSGKILDRLRDHVKETLSQSEEGESKDGMDIALCVLDSKKMTLQYAGAYNPLYLIRDKELSEYKANRMPIGIHVGEESRFTDHTIQLRKGDCIYVFSDGFQDQIGGEKGKKFLSKSMKALLTEIHNQPMMKQKEVLGDVLGQWMKGFQQVDDILILGVRI